MAEPTPVATPRVVLDDLIGRTLGKYRVMSQIGEGGMGKVYEAVNTTIQKRVALKCIDQELADDEESVARFQREALAASAVDSPYIVQIFDAGNDDGMRYIVMELLRGRDLGTLIKERGRLSAGDAVVVTRQVLKGLARAHDAGIVHRDLKPDNVFLVEHEGEPARVKLLDFGVSKIISREGVPLKTLTQQGMVVGTPHYMSPEQAQAMPDVDHRTDIYAVGAMLYQCLVGQTPHTGHTYEQVIVNICMHDADDVREHNRDVPDALAEVVRKALSREAHQRYGSAREMLAVLDELGPASSVAGIELSPGRIDTSPQAPALANTVQASSVDSLPAAQDKASGIKTRVDTPSSRDEVTSHPGADSSPDASALLGTSAAPAITQPDVITQPGAPELAQRARAETAPPSLPEPSIGAPPQRSLMPWMAGAAVVAALLLTGLYLSNSGGEESDALSRPDTSATASALPAARQDNLATAQSSSAKHLAPPSSAQPNAAQPNAAQPSAAQPSAPKSQHPAHGTTGSQPHTTRPRPTAQPQPTAAQPTPPAPQPPTPPTPNPGSKPGSKPSGLEIMKR